MRVKDVREAWEVANMIFPYEYEKDTVRSKETGYPVYMASDGHIAWISDLGDRLEVNLPDKSVNISIGEREDVINEAVLLKYLKSMMDNYKAEEALYGVEDRIVRKKVDAMIACKEMVETLIRKPVNLGVDGTVTVGF